MSPQQLDKAWHTWALKEQMERFVARPFRKGQGGWLPDLSTIGLP
jgi:hypothetical protein